MVSLLFVLMPLLLQGGIIEGPFRIADAEPRHHQVHLRAAMAPDGRFAVMWQDSLDLNEPGIDLAAEELFVRFFNSDGNPLADPYKITKLVDTNYVYGACLDMDTLGNTILVWAEGGRHLENSHTRFQVFAPDGHPVDSARIMCPGGAGGHSRLGLSIANNGEFAVVCPTRFSERGYGLWVQRFDLEGVPQDSAFLAHDTLEGTVKGSFEYTQVTLNDAGDVVVTWLHFIETGHMYPRFQVFDADDEPILPWEPLGYRLDDGGERCGACRPEPHWLDNDRFVAFYSDYCAPRPTPFIPVLGRVFSNRGLTRHPIRTVIWGDSLALSSGDPRGQFCTAISPNDSFAYTHTRSYSDHPDTSEPWRYRCWEHGTGFLGEVINNEPWRRTTLFEYTPAWGADTVNSHFNNRTHTQTPAVACSNDRIVWVYSRLNTDTIFEAYAMITDWDMGVGVAESPIQTASPIHLEASLNWLSYDVSGSVTGEASLTLYSADGRKVLEETIEGKGIWTPPSSHLPSGVYFARVSTGGYSARTKVVVLR